LDIIGSIDIAIDLLNTKIDKLNKCSNYIYKYMFYNKINKIKKIKFNFIENKYVSKIGNNVCPFINEKYYIATANVSNTTIESTDTLINYTNRPIRANNMPIKNTIWFAKMKNTNKKILITEDDEDLINNYIFSTGFQGLQLDEKYLYYYWEYINEKSFEEYKDSNSSGATQQAIDETTLKQFTIELPNDEDIFIFNKLVTPIYKKKSLLRKQIIILKKYKGFLLPLMLNEQVL